MPVMQQGAKYNRKIQSRSGIDPSLLPPVKTYSGHYHIHHIVPNTETRYIGSLFQSESFCLITCMALQMMKLHMHVPFFPLRL